MDNKYTEEEIGLVLADGSLSQVAHRIALLAYLMGLDSVEGFDPEGLDQDELLDVIENSVQWLSDTATSGACDIAFDGSKVEVVGL